MTKPEVELVKIKFISVLRDAGSQLRLLDGIKIKPTMTLREITDSLQLRGKKMAFASSSTDNKPVIEKKKSGYNKNAFKKLSEKFTGNKGNGHLGKRCGGKPHSSKPCPALNNIYNTCD